MGTETKSVINSRLVRFAIPALLMAVVIWRFDIGAALRSIATIDAGRAVGAVAALLVMLVLQAVSWIVVVRSLEIDVSLRTILRAFALGVAGSGIVGEGAGSLSRLVDMQAAGASVAATTYAVVVDKGYNVIVLLAWVPVAAIVLPASAAFNPWLASALAVGLLVLVALALSRWAVGGLSLVAERLRIERLSRLGDLKATAAKMSASRHLLVAVVSAAARLAQFVFVWLLAVGLAVPISFLEMSAAMTVVGLAVLLPISINGLGVRELTMVGVFELAGYTAEAALAVSLSVFVVTFAMRLGVGLLWAIRKPTSVARAG